MDGLGKAGRIGAAGDGQGAFENFLASAIATIVTIIFSWRLLLETQESSGPLALEAAGGKEDKSGPTSKRTGGRNATTVRNPREVTQVNIDQKTVSKVTSKPALTPLLTADAVHEANMTEGGYRLLRAQNHLNLSERGKNHSGLNVTPDLAVSANTWEGNLDQYSPAPGEAAAVRDNNKHTLDSNNRTPNSNKRVLDSNSEAQTNPEGLLPRPSWALNNQPTVTSTARIELSTAGLSPSDSSGEEDTETEGDVSTDSTLEFHDDDDDDCDADLSESDNSLSNSAYSSSDTREFYLVGDPLGDDDSESEYCVVFNNMLEAITEEDTDDLSEIEREAEELKAQYEKNMELDRSTDDVDSFIIPQVGNEVQSDPANYDSKNSELDDETDRENDKVEQMVQTRDSDLAVNNDNLSEAELTSDTNSIDVSIDSDANEGPSATSAVYGPIMNTQRPLVIGPYRDRGSKFSQEQVIPRADVMRTDASPSRGRTDASPSRGERDKNPGSSTGASRLPFNSSNEGSYLERARAILWQPFPSEEGGDFERRTPNRYSSPELEITQPPPSRTSPAFDAVRSLPETVSNVERQPFQSSSDKKIEEDKHDLDGSQDIGERKEFNSNVSDDQGLTQPIHGVLDDRSSTTADSDLDSLTECFDQFKKVALNHLENTTPSQASVDIKQPTANEIDRDMNSDHNIGFSTSPNSDTWPDKYKEGNTDNSTPSLSKIDFEDHKPLSDSQKVAQVVYGRSIDNLPGSDKLSSGPEDAQISTSSTENQFPQSRKFVRTLNVEQNYVLRNITQDKNIGNNGDNNVLDDKEFNEGNMREGTNDMANISPYGARPIGGLNSVGNKNPANNATARDGLYSRSQFSTQGDFTQDDKKHDYVIEIDTERHQQPRGGPIAETTVGKFAVRPHPSYQELNFGNEFPSHQDTKQHDHDQPIATNTLFNKGSNEVGFQGNEDMTSDLTRTNNRVQPNETNVYDQGGAENAHQQNFRPQESTQMNTAIDKFDPQYFQSMQPYTQNGHSYSSDPNQNQLANRKLYTVDTLADQETFGLHGNIVAYQDMMEKRDTPCRVVATSSAMARRGDLDGMDPELPPAGSAFASTEATSDNPYIAVARATARAATIASANATAGAMSSDPNGQGSPEDISVVVSTSCTIKDGGRDPTNTAPKLIYPEEVPSADSTEIQLTPKQKKKMMITIEESQKDSTRREYRTLECEVPKHVDGDVTAMISEAVKRIIASQSSLAHQRGNQLNKAIDQITRQVVSAYKEPDSGFEEIPRYSIPPQRLALYDVPMVKSETIPEFRAQKTPKVYQGQVPARPAPRRDQNPRPGAYLSRVINPPSDPKQSVLFRENDEKPVFYVTGKYPTANGEAHSAEDVVLKVVTDEDMRPSVEHVLLSESESDKDTPSLERKQYHKMKQITEEDPVQVSGLDRTKKRKPARPKLTQPEMAKVDEYAYVPPESWSECSGCEDNGEVKKPDEPKKDKTVKGILKSRPNSSTADDTSSRGSSTEDDSKSKSAEDISGQNKNQPFVRSGPSQTKNQRPPRPVLGMPPVKEKKPYQSILLTPVKDEIPIHITEPASNPALSPTSDFSKKSFFKDPASKPEIPQDVPVAIPNTRPTRIDIEFERRKRDWRARTPSPKGSVVMVDIDIDPSKNRKPRSKSVEDLKRKLSKASLKAPSNEHIDKHWEGVSEKLSRSQERFLDRDFRSREGSFSSETSQPYSMRRSNSMGTLPGQFFNDRRSYTSLIETDLDTGLSTEIPLIRETNLDDFLTKSKSMTNLNTATNFRTYDISSDDVKYRSSEMISGGSSQSSEREPLNQVPAERSSSAHELRITNSLSKLSLPPWFKATSNPLKKPVQLMNTKTPPRIPYELPTPDEKSSRNRSKLEILPSKPIVIKHRVSTSTSKSPGSSTPTTPIGGPQAFELPSNRLRQQNRETSLAPIPIKSPEVVPPLPARNYHEKETARDSYLKLKAKSNPDSWEPLSSLNTLHGSEASSRQIPKETRPSTSDFTDEGIVTHRPKRQEEIYISQKSMNVNNSEDSSLASEPLAPRLPPRNYYESSDSGVASLEHHRSDNSGLSPETSMYNPGKTVSNLVRDLEIDTSQLSPVHDSGIDSASPDGVYKKMITTLEDERKDIENKASEISSPYTPDTQSIMQEKGEKAQEINRDDFPLLSLNTSPGMKRRSFRSLDSLGTAKEPEPSAVSVSFSRRSFRDDGRNEATILDGQRKHKSTNSLEEVLGGLLAIPPPPGHPDDEEEEFNSESEGKKETPKERNFKILKQAASPRGNNRNNTSVEEQGRDQSETEIDEDTVMIKCRNTKCGRKDRLTNARNSYKTCHNCFTYYCSRDCRREHWERHKRKCLFSRINSGCKHIVKKVQNSDSIAEELSKIARTGYLTKGRGCVMLVFTSPMEADKFLLKGFEACREHPANYANIKDLQEQIDVFGDHEKDLMQSCKSYNPELKYVFEVAIVTSADEIPKWPIPRREGTVIKKCAKVRLHSTAASKQAKTDDPETLVLTAVPGSEFTENMEERQAREICLVNIQRQLRQRGVSLRHQYPEVYKRLCAYVADNEHFTPISLYPVDSSTGKRFMCLIMPNSEPEVNWMYNPNLLGDLDLHSQI